MKKRSNKLRGFTLIELMIVVAIIGILAAIAIPNFIRYQLRAKTAEAKTVLGGIKTSQESFRAELDNYAGDISSNPTSAPGTIKAGWTNTACATTCNRTGTDTCTSFSCIGYSPSGLVYYQYDSASTSVAGTGIADFCASAAGDLDGDAASGSFEYQSANTVGTTVGVEDCGLGACAAGINAGEVTDCAPNVY